MKGLNVILGAPFSSKMFYIFPSLTCVKQPEGTELLL